MTKKSVKFPNVAYKYPKKVLMFWSQDPEWEMTPRVMESIRTLLNPRSPTAHLNLANHLNYAYCAPALFISHFAYHGEQLPLVSF